MARRDDEDSPSTLEQILGRLTQAVEVLATRPDVAQDLPDLNARLTLALERLSESQIQGAKLIADETRRAHRPSNEVVPNISVFNRRGTLLESYQKPPLKCIILLPWIAEWESLTREEVELMNLLEPGDYSMVRNDESEIGGFTITMEYKSDNKTPSSLLLNHPTAFNNENGRLLPPLTNMLRQLLDQHSPEIVAQAALVMTDREEARLIKAGSLEVSK